LAAAHVPILSLSGIETEGIAGQAVQRGAQDYLLDDRLDSYSLTQTLRSIIDRRAGEEMLFIEKERAQVTLNSLGDAVLYFEGSPGPRRGSDQRLVPRMRLSEAQVTTYRTLIHGKQPPIAEASATTQNPPAPCAWC
jgi:hypothetical protein